MTAGLPDRIPAIRDLVPDDATHLADIGCGEGQLIRSLRQKHPRLPIVGVDPSPHIQALLNQKWMRGSFGAQAGITIRPGLCFDSIRDLSPDVVVFAGLGETTILDCLTSGIPSCVRRLIVSPVHHAATLRSAMPDLGWRVVDETLSQTRGRYYTASAYERGDELLSSSPGFLFGPQLFEQRSVHLYDYLIDLRTRLATTIAHRNCQTLPVRRLCDGFADAIQIVSEFSDSSSSSSDSLYGFAA